MRNEDFVEKIVDTFTKTKSIARTVETVKLDRSLVVYWLKKQGVDIRGQGAYNKEPISRANVILGSTIAMHRLQQGWGSPSDLAAQAGMSVKKMSAIEKGEKDILFSELARISDALGVKITELVEKL